MNINDTRKSPIQTTIGGWDLTPGKTYQLVEEEGNIDGYGEKGDIFLAATRRAPWSVRTEYAVNLSTGAALWGPLLNTQRFIPVDAEVVIK